MGSWFSLVGVQVNSLAKRFARGQRLLKSSFGGGGRGASQVGWDFYGGRWPL